MQIVSLTTDFGYTDYHIAELKAALLKINPNIQIVDVAHNIDTFDIVEAAYIVNNVYRSFVLETIHIVSVYNYYDTNCEIIVCARDGQFFISPNNGLISLLFPDIERTETYIIDTHKIKNTSLANMFAHAVGCISHGLPLSELGDHPTSINKKISIQPVITANQIRATIIHIDHFGNVVVNVKREQFYTLKEKRRFAIFYQQNDPILHISDHYGEKAIGEVVCVFNSAGYMEIAINLGNASELLSLRKNETIQINFYD